MGSSVTVAIVAIVAALALVGCAPFRRCNVVQVPIEWNDGTRSVWAMTICRHGEPALPRSPESR